MSLAKELVEALEKMAAVIVTILKEFEGRNGLIKEMKSYKLKKNIAKTTGTVIGIAGVCLMPFTFGWSLAVTAAGAGVNLVTEFVDSVGSQAFRDRMAKHLDSYKEQCKKYQQIVKRLESDIEKPSSDVYAALLYCALSSARGASQTDKLDKKKLEMSKTELIFKGGRMAGLALTLQQTENLFAKSVLADIGLSTAKGIGKGIGKATIIFAGVVSAYETVTLFMDWNGTHPTIASAQQVVHELKTAKVFLNKRIFNLKQSGIRFDLFKYYSYIKN